MKLKKILCILAFFVVLTAACSHHSAEQTIFEWGTTKDAIIKMEKANGNRSFNKKEMSNQINIEFKNISIDGKKANVEYILKKEIENKSMTLEDSVEKIHEMPKSIKLKNYGLVEINHFFLDINKDDRKKIYNFLVSKYGAPDQTESKTYFWEVDDMIVYFDGKAYVSYKAKLSSLTDYLDD